MTPELGQWVNLNIETTDYCNQRCGYCNQTNKINAMHGLGTKNAFMDVEVFKRLVDKMEGGVVRAFSPYWSGEPLLHPKTPELFRYLFEASKQKGIFEEFFMNTNGYYLTEEVAEILLDYAAFIERAPLNRRMFITFSLDSVTPAIYSRIRGVAEHHLETILANIDRFLHLRAKRKICWPSVTYQAVVCPENFDELEAFRTYWQTRLDRLGVPYTVLTQLTYLDRQDAIFFRQRDEGDFSAGVKMKLLHDRAVERLNGRQVPQDDENRQTVSRNMESATPAQGDWLKTKRACRQLWSMLIVSKDGRAVPCCKDLFFELKLGNLKEQSINELWHGERLKTLRLEQIQGQFDRHVICSNCINPPGGELRLEEVVAYLESVNRLDLLADYVDRLYAPGVTST